MMLRVLMRSVLAALVAAATSALAQQQPLVAGSDGVPVPRKSREVKPVYPPDAMAKGVRGIVILELVIDQKGHVGSVTVIRSVPGLDAAAISAAQQWQYEPVKVNGVPASVRLTVPITFALELPRMAREPGVPELRQGRVPATPAGANGPGAAAAELTLEPDGRIASVQLSSGSEPWAGALLDALKTWRFAPPPADALVSFRVEAAFADRNGPVSLRATGVHLSDLMGAPIDPTPTRGPAPLAAEQPPTPGAPDGAKGDAPAGQAEERERSPAEPPPGAPAAPGSVPDAPVPPAGPTAPPGTPRTTQPSPADGVPEHPPAREPQPSGRASVAPPPIEVITAPPPEQPPESGFSAVRDVSLEPGVPELSRGRRPTPPPLARMAHVAGQVEVMFSVGAAGTTAIQKVAGPDLLKTAAEQTVASWVFRRTRADRAYLLAVIDYREDKASANVRPQPAPNPQAATPAAAPAGPGATPDQPAAVSPTPSLDTNPPPALPAGAVRPTP